jgi:hypothetical protein
MRRQFYRRAKDYLLARKREKISICKLTVKI